MPRQLRRPSDARGAGGAATAAAPSGLWAVVWANDTSKIVEETGAPFDDVLEPIRTYGAVSLLGWCVVPLTEELERQYRALDQS
jgi:hypothetical protein